jgi:hypothetical protein
MSSTDNARHEAQINPYASPAEAGGYNDRQRFGIGVWRDGPLLVMHQKAELPRFCIHTGEPAVGGREYVLVWKPQGAIFTTSKPVMIPLCRKCANQFLRLRLQVFAAIGLAAIGGGLVFSAPLLNGWTEIGALAGVGVLIFAILYGLYALGMNSRQLTVVRSEGDYLWIAEVHSGLLRQVPDWPPKAA